ncbi:hypothetical protein F511_20257 [Dorcoceras hygrometricum]|uniref:Uncharacterized protein n=1 Tax=Dorcoceras hygrometricum TaxID=472368 RepID=A0A2Z7BVB4_9LAMI|nr:hypothetical protein F511_20257 [Dorcoceras hygrometricum]
MLAFNSGDVSSYRWSVGFQFEEKSVVVGVQMLPSVLSVAGASTSSFGLAKKTQLKFSCDTLATVHRTLSSLIADGRQLRIGDASFYVALERLLEAGELLSVLGLTPCPSGAGVVFLYVFLGYHGYSAGRGVDPAGGAPEGG